MVIPDWLLYGLAIIIMIFVIIAPIALVTLGIIVLYKKAFSPTKPKPDANKTEQIAPKAETTDNSSKINEQPQQPTEPQVPAPPPKPRFAGHYQPKFILTRREWFEWRKLQKYTNARGLLICPKVRLLDIIEPRKGDPNYMSYMGKIKSKHVDFVICDQFLVIRGIIELDDSTHDRKDRKERDEFVDEILTSVGYKVIHTYSITESTLDAITGPRMEETHL